MNDINVEKQKIIAIKSADQLNHAGRRLDCPFSIGLEHDEHALTCISILRNLPGKRLVAFANWQGQPVIAKIFYHRARAHLHAYREQNGNQALSESNVLTPTILYAGQDSSKSLYVLIFSYVQPKVPLNAVWEDPKHVDWSGLTKNIVEITAKLHQSGLLQNDPHPNNFLWGEAGIYTLDTGDMEITKHRLSLPRRISFRSLGNLFAQIRPAGSEHLFEFYETYANARNWNVTKEDYQTVLVWQQYHRSERQRKIQRKVLRNSTRFMHQQNSRYTYVCQRDLYHEDLSHFFQNPTPTLESGEVLDNQDGLLKARVDMAGRSCLLVRYKASNILRSMRYRFMGSPAKKAWCVAQFLKSYGVNTAQPIAVMEKHSDLFCSGSYYVCDYIEGDSFAVYMQKHSLESLASDPIVQQVIDLFMLMRQLNISHQALSPEAILVGYGKVYLSRLDHVTIHRDVVSAKQSLYETYQTFMQSWKSQPDIFQFLLEKFQQHPIWM